MRRLPIKQGYAGCSVVLFYSGEYMIINNNYHLFFVANSEGIIYDTLLLDGESVTITNKEVRTVKGEVFNRIQSYLGRLLHFPLPAMGHFMSHPGIHPPSEFSDYSTLAT